MKACYHIELTRLVLAPHFAAPALDDVIRANLGQDALRYQLGTHPHFHFDNNQIAEGLAYVEQQHAEIVALVAVEGSRAAARQRACLGRLLHAVQDFYAHSNYVDLWLARYTAPGQSMPQSSEINGLDAEILGHPDLMTGSFKFWRDIVYYIPVAGWLARRFLGVPATSHEGMNLDAPDRGPSFVYAFEAARQRTAHEWQRAAAEVQAAGGEAAYQRFIAG